MDDFKSTGKGININLWVVFIHINWGKRFLWFRWFETLGGYKIKSLKRNNLLFSERNGHAGFKICGYMISKLK